MVWRVSTGVAAGGAYSSAGSGVTSVGTIVSSASASNLHFALWHFDFWLFVELLNPLPLANQSPETNLFVSGLLIFCESVIIKSDSRRILLEIKVSGGRILGLLQCRVSAITVSERVINNFLKKNEDTRCKAIGYFRYRIRYSSEIVFK